MREKIFLFLLTALLIINFISAESYGYNLLKPGENLNPSTNFSKKTVNASEIWITNEGNLDNVNSSQFENNGNTLSIIQSFLTNLIGFHGLTQFLALDQSNWFNDSAGWVYWTGNNQIKFNATKLQTQFFNASSVDVITGTPQGSIVDIRSYNLVSYNVSEDASDLELRVNFTNIDDFNNLIIRYKSEEDDEPHTMNVQIYEPDNGVWESYGTLPSTGSYQVVEFGIFDADEHIGDDDVVQVRFFQDQGVPPRTHKHLFDWVTISLGFGTPAGEEVDPFALYKDGSTPLTDVWNVGNSQINMSNLSTAFIGSPSGVINFRGNNFNGSGNFTTIGTGKFGEIIVDLTQDYKISESTLDNTDLTIKGQTPNINAFLEITDFDGDGTEFVGYYITPRRGASFERIGFFFNPGADEWWIQQLSAGNDYPLVFSIFGSNQLVLSKDILGVGIGKMPSTTLDVAGTGRFDGNLGIKTSGIPTFELEVKGEVAITGDAGVTGSDAPDVMTVTGGKGGRGSGEGQNGFKGSDIIITSGGAGDAGSVEDDAGFSGDITLRMGPLGGPGGGGYGNIYLAENGGCTIIGTINTSRCNTTDIFIVDGYSWGKGWRVESDRNLKANINLISESSTTKLYEYNTYIDTPIIEYYLEEVWYIDENEKNVSKIINKSRVIGYKQILTPLQIGIMTDEAPEKVVHCIGDKCGIDTYELASWNYNEIGKVKDRLDIAETENQMLKSFQQDICTEQNEIYNKYDWCDA